MSDENKLTKKQQVFIDEYLRCFNASEAARRAGYKSKANVIGSQLLANPSISAEVQARLAEIHMSSDEALKLVADIARGDMGDFLNDYGGVTIDDVRKSGQTKLIKKWKTKTITINGKQEDKEIHTEEIELYPADSALALILKAQGKIKPDGQFEIVVKYANSDDKPTSPA